jgi:hypothetical protein
MHQTHTLDRIWLFGEAILYSYLTSPLNSLRLLSSFLLQTIDIHLHEFLFQFSYYYIEAQLYYL